MHSHQDSPEWLWSSTWIPVTFWLISHDLMIVLGHLSPLRLSSLSQAFLCRDFILKLKAYRAGIAWFWVFCLALTMEWTVLSQINAAHVSLLGPEIGCLCLAMTLFPAQFLRDGLIRCMMSSYGIESALQMHCVTWTDSCWGTTFALLFHLLAMGPQLLSKLGSVFAFPWDSSTCSASNPPQKWPPNVYIYLLGPRSADLHACAPLPSELDPCRITPSLIPICWLWLQTLWVSSSVEGHVLHKPSSDLQPPLCISSCCLLLVDLCPLPRNVRYLVTVSSVDSPAASLIHPRVSFLSHTHSPFQLRQTS